jgi:asparagine synthase (glutamine-hydrolysing)
MSAICAAFRRSGGPATGEQAAAMLAAMHEYGADISVWERSAPGASVALGCIPWRVTHEDACYRPPVRSADGTLVLVADARLDNRSDLAPLLGIGSRDAAALPDAAFILAAYQKWGEECPRHLVGDFAFALWDERRQTLFCARDSMGQRVLFYHESADGMVLATTAHALASLPSIRTRLDEQKVADFLVLLQRTDTTFFENVRRLPPGHTLRLDHSGARFAQYWSSMPARPVRFARDEEYVEGFLEVFEAAVSAQLRCEGTAGMMLSGGLDSSSVAAVAAQHLRERGRTLPTFHAAPREGFSGRVQRGRVADESGDVQAIARLHPNIALHVRRNDDRSPLADIETSFRMTGAPPRNPGNAPWFYALYELARDSGVRVMLSGHKGNATISQTGMRSIRDSAARGDFGRVWREVHAVARVTGEGRRGVLQREVITTLTPAAVASLVRRLGGKSARPVWDATFSAVRPEFARAMDLEARVQAANRNYLDINRLSEMDLRITTLAGGADVFDLYSGYRPWFGIETRDPTADRRVVEYCMAIPGSQYLRNGETRSLIRRAMQGRLPDQVRTRTTYGLQGPDWTEWMPSIRPELASELAKLERSDTANRCLDLPRMRHLMDQWPDRMTLSHEKQYYLMLLRGITMGRFIRWFEETYAA